MDNLIWPFENQPNTSVIANRKIISFEEWIAFFSHDNEDGAGQFHTHPSVPLCEVDAMLVSLQNIVSLDRSLIALADLLLGK